MSGLNNMKKRLQYMGGAKQEDRMIADKLRSLRKALLYSYQAATAELTDGRQFRCLINPNKVTMELDDKILSIPYRDICLNGDKESEEDIILDAVGADSETVFIQENQLSGDSLIVCQGNGKTSNGFENTNVSIGSVVKWVETNTYWIVYFQYLTEDAYFRGMMRQCEDLALDINGVSHYYYLKGPDEKGIDWQKSKHFIFNELNYTVEMYISNTIEANEFFHRFTKIKLPVKKPNGETEFRPYEVQAVDDISSAGILTVYLKEDYTNEWARNQAEEDSSAPEDAIDPLSARIDGPNEAYPYDIVQYSAVNTAGGKWLLSNSRAKIVKQNESSITIEITTGKSGSVDLIYRVDGKEDIVYNISILSL